jgi:alanine dehydrogenase
MSARPILLDRAAVASVFGMPEALQAARSAFLSLAKDRAVMPQRLAVNVAEHAGTHLSMPCYVSGEDGEALTIKIATVFGQNPKRFGLPTTLAFLLLQDPRTGALLALMDAEYLTAQRTGAASGVATDLLAKSDAKVVTLFGAGGQAGAQVEAMLAVRPVERVNVVSLELDKAEGFAASLRDQHGVQARAMIDRAQAVSEADIVCAATNATTPLFPAEAVGPGTHVNAVGAFRGDMAELPAELLGQALVVVDRLEAAQAGAGDLIQAADAGQLSWSDVRELGSLLLEGAPDAGGRPTVFKSVGLAVQDAIAAAAVYRRAVEQGLGQPFDLH